MNEQHDQALLIAKRLEMQRKVAVRQIEWDALVRALPYAIQSLTAVVQRRIAEGETR